VLSRIRDFDRWDRVAGILSIIIIGALLAKSLSRGIDFHVLYVSGQRALSGSPIYLFSDGWMPFKYHPVWAAIALPVSLLPERLAFALFNAAMLGCWVWAASIWAGWLGYDIRKPANFLLLGMLTFNPLSAEMNFGQTNGILFIGATKLFQWLNERPQKWFAAGLLVAFLCSLKLNVGLLAIYCVVRNFRSLSGMLTGALAIHIVTAAVFGHWFDLELYRSWLDVLLGQSAEQYLDPDVQGLLRFLLLTSPDFGRGLWLLCVVLAVACGFALERNLGASPALVAAYWLSTVYLLSPLAWWNQILLTFPLAFALLRENINRFERWVLSASLAIYALASPTLLTRAGIETFRGYHGFFFATVAIVAVMATSQWRARRAAAPGSNAGGTIALRVPVPVKPERDS